MQTIVQLHRLHSNCRDYSPTLQSNCTYRLHTVQLYVQTTYSPTVRTDYIQSNCTYRLQFNCTYRLQSNCTDYIATVQITVQLYRLHSNCGDYSPTVRTSYSPTVRTYYSPTVRTDYTHTIQIQSKPGKNNG